MKAPAIKRLRLRLNLSQAKFAEMLGVDQATVSRIERGAPLSGPLERLLRQMEMGLR